MGSILSASYYDNDPIYGVTKSGDSIRIDVIENDFEFSRKLRFDSKFRWDFANFTQNQPLSWYYRNFNQLGGWRVLSLHLIFIGTDMIIGGTAQNIFYFNGDSIHGTHLGIGIDGIDGMGIHIIIIGIDHLETEVAGYVWNNYRRDNRNISYNIGRRGSNVVVVTPNGSSREEVISL